MDLDVRRLSLAGTIPANQTEPIKQIIERGMATGEPTIIADASPSLAASLEEIAGIIRRYIVLPHPHLEILIALWVANTYVFERFRYCGYLAIRSATPGCGKSYLLELIAMFSNGRPSVTGIPTAATLYRRVGQARPVLILDEVDNLRNADKDTHGQVLAVLNLGFKQGAMIERLDGSNRKDDFPVKTFGIYSPKAFAGIARLADTLASRCFQIHLQRATERLPRLNERTLEAETASRLRETLTRWADLRGEEIEELYRQLPDAHPDLAAYDSRFQDIAEGLLILATLADGEATATPPIVPRFLIGLQAAASRRAPTGREQEFIAFLDLAASWLGEKPEVFVETATLLTVCQEQDELARIEHPRQLAAMLREFDLHGGKDGTQTKRGYSITRDWLGAWRSRYPKPTTDNEREGGER